MFRQLVEAFRNARAYQQVNQLRWLKPPQWIWRCITFLWYTNMVCILIKAVVVLFIPNTARLAHLLVDIGFYSLMTIPVIFVASVLFISCRNIYLIARFVMDPTYENE